MKVHSQNDSDICGVCPPALYDCIAWILYGNANFDEPNSIDLHFVTE